MKFSKKYIEKKMFLQKFDILINKQASLITNFNDEVTKLPASDEITRIDGIFFIRSEFFIRFSFLLCFSLHYTDFILFLSYQD
jgi:hypothetical protein